MRQYLSLAFPFGLVFLLLSAAFMLYGADTRLSAYLLSGLILMTAAGGLISSREPRAVPPVVLAGVALIVASLALEAMAGTLHSGIPHYAELGAAGALFLIGRLGTMREDRIEPLWTLLLCVLLVLAAWAFIDFFVNPDTIHGRPRPYHVDRLSAAFLSANTAATFFGVGMLAAGVGVLRGLRKVASFDVIDLAEGLFRHAVISLMTFMFCITCLMLTASRAGIAFALICLAVLFIWEFLSRRDQAAMPSWRILMPALLAGIALVAVLFWSMSGDMAAQRYAELSEDTGTRQMMYEAYWAASFEAPILGHGLGSFDAVNDRIMTADNAHVLSGQGAAHNIFLQWLIQRGFLGGLAMWGAVGLILLQVGRGLSVRRRHHTYMRGVLIISLFVILHGQVDYALEIPGFMWWWALILGFGAGIADGGTSARTAPAAKRKRA